MDIISVIHKNYKLLDYQLELWSKIQGEHRLIVGDNTHTFYRQDHPAIRYLLPVHDFDGVSHGKSLDYLITKTETNIIGIIDSDFFWLNSNIILEVEEYFKQGYKCVGAAGFYPDWQRVIDTTHPNHAGHLAPVIFGMFVDRKLAEKHTFVCTPEEGSRKMYTGWRLREHIINNNIPCITFQGESDKDDPELTYFYYNGKLQGIHLLKGSNPSRQHLTSKLPRILQEKFN